MKFRIIFLLFFFSLTSSFLFSQEKVKALKGEGIHALLRRHNLEGKEYYQEFIEINKAKLGKNNSLLSGVDYELPQIKALNASVETTEKASAKTTKTEALFGEKYAEYSIESEKLKGACFYLVCGHGGPDPGAVAKIKGRELHEDEYAYDVTLRLARALLMEGAVVHIIIQDKEDGIRDDLYLSNSNRESCMGDEIPLKQIDRLKQRCDKINHLEKKQKESYQRAIFIHLDSRSNKKQIDVFFYHYENSKNGKKLADNLKNTFQEHYDKHQPNRGFKGTVSARNLYVLKNTVPIAVFAELGNLHNELDQKRFLNYNNRQALANWICRGFIKDYEASKKAEK